MSPAVARIHPGAIGQLGEDALLEVGDEAGEPLRIVVGVARAAGEQRVAGEQVRLVGQLAAAVVEQSDAAGRVAAQVNDRQAGVADGHRVAVVHRAW